MPAPSPRLPGAFASAWERAGQRGLGGGLRPVPVPRWSPNTHAPSPGDGLLAGSADPPPHPVSHPAGALAWRDGVGGALTWLGLWTPQTATCTRAQNASAKHRKPWQGRGRSLRAARGWARPCGAGRGPRPRPLPEAGPRLARALAPSLSLALSGNSSTIPDSGSRGPSGPPPPRAGEGGRPAAASWRGAEPGRAGGTLPGPETRLGGRGGG